LILSIFRLFPIILPGKIIFFGERFWMDIRIVVQGVFSPRKPMTARSNSGWDDRGERSGEAARKISPVVSSDAPKSVRTIASAPVGKIAQTYRVRRKFTVVCGRKTSRDTGKHHEGARMRPHKSYKQRNN
jgi:hypothetical protein